MTDNAKNKAYCDRVASYYDEDCEEARFVLPYKQLEKINTEFLLDKYVREKMNVLDCASGTGVYIDYLLKKGANVIASDLSERHVSLIKKAYGDKVQAYNDNAMDLSRHSDEKFDVILCCGPLYHLSYEDSVICVKECLRKIKKGGKVIVAYMNKHFVAFDLMFSDYYKTSFDEALNIAREGECPQKQGFYGCARFVSPEEIEDIADKAGATIVEHITVDADIPYFFKNMQNYDMAQIEKIAQYIREIGSRPTMLGCGKHNLIILTRKNENE